MVNVRDFLVPAPPAEQKRAYRDRVARLNAYADWLEETGRAWHELDLVTYQKYLLDERQLTPTSTNAHIYTVRARYRELLEDGTLQNILEELWTKNLNEDQLRTEVSAALEKIRAAVASRAAILDAERPDVEYRRLEAKHIRVLLASPDAESAVGLRDRAIFALMFATGLRNNEVCALEVKNLYDSVPTGRALHVPPGRGCTERLVPYGDLEWGLELVETWFRGPADGAARRKGGFPIENGPVFRGFYRGSTVLRPSGLSSRSLDYIFNAYPINFEGEAITVRPMDLRRAYARLLFEARFELEAIKERLGITDSDTLMDYIGGPEARLGLPLDENPFWEGTWLRTE